MIRIDNLIDTKPISNLITKHYDSLATDDASVFRSLLLKPEEGGRVGTQMLEYWLENNDFTYIGYSIKRIYATPSSFGRVVEVRTIVTYSKGQEGRYTFFLRYIQGEWKIISFSFATGP